MSNSVKISQRIVEHFARSYTRQFTTVGTVELLLFTRRIGSAVLRVHKTPIIASTMEAWLDAWVHQTMHNHAPREVPLGPAAVQ
jgi:hypothetical protein